MRDRFNRSSGKKLDDMAGGVLPEAAAQRPSPSSLGSILADAIAEAGYEDVLIDLALQECLPKNLRGRVVVLSVRRGVLELRASHGAVAQELSIHADEIVDRANLLLPEAKRIQSIRIR